MIFLLRECSKSMVVVCSGDRYFMPNAPSILSREDKTKFLENLQNLKFPSQYVSNISKKITNGKFGWLKSHDYHVLMQQVLLTCTRNLDDGRLMGTVMHLSRLFQQICSKVVDPETKVQMLVDATEVLSGLEKDLPPSFWRISGEL